MPFFRPIYKAKRAHIALKKLENLVLWHMEVHRGCNTECERIFLKDEQGPDADILREYLRRSDTLRYDTFSKDRYPFLEYDVGLILLNPDILDTSDEI